METISTRPRGVTCAAILQLLLAAVFLLSAAVAIIHGGDAQAAAETELARQGLPASVLTDQNVRFDEGAAGTVLPVAIATVLTVLALLNLAGNRVARLLSWICQPLLIVAGTVIIPGQLFTADLIESAFRASGDAMLARIDVRAVVDAAAHQFPAWLPLVVVAKLVLATVGSVLVVVLLAIPSARSYFRANPST